MLIFLTFCRFLVFFVSAGSTVQGVYRFSPPPNPGRFALVYLQFPGTREKLQGGLLKAFGALFGHCSVNLSDEVLARFFCQVFDQGLDQGLGEGKNQKYRENVSKTKKKHLSSFKIPLNSFTLYGNKS